MSLPTPVKCIKFPLGNYSAVVCMGDDHSWFWVELYPLTLRLSRKPPAKREELGEMVATSDLMRYDSHVRIWFREFFYPGSSYPLGGADAELQDEAVGYIMEAFEWLQKVEVLS